MTNPNMPNIPGIGAMTDTLDFVKNLWGGMGIPGMNMPGMSMPGMVMPTLSVEEVNKQISDLKAVESWLTLNMNMLRGTIQALEVQSATLSTLQSMSETLSSVGKSGAGEKPAAAASYPFSRPAAAESPAAPEPADKPSNEEANSAAPLANPAAWWNMLQDQFKQAVSSAMTPEAPPAAAAKPAKAPRKRKAPAPKP